MNDLLRESKIFNVTIIIVLYAESALKQTEPMS